LVASLENIRLIRNPELSLVIYNLATESKKLKRYEVQTSMTQAKAVLLYRKVNIVERLRYYRST